MYKPPLCIARPHWKQNSGRKEKKKSKAKTCLLSKSATRRRQLAFATRRTPLSSSSATRRFRCFSKFCSSCRNVRSHLSPRRLVFVIRYIVGECGDRLWSLLRCMHRVTLPLFGKLWAFECEQTKAMGKKGNPTLQASNLRWHNMLRNTVNERPDTSWTSTKSVFAAGVCYSVLMCIYRPDSCITCTRARFGEKKRCDLYMSIYGSPQVVSFSRQR